MTDWGALYHANIDAVTALAAGADQAELSTRVPATPAWTVREVLAHLAGSPADALSGRMDGAPGDAWTARHVRERAQRSTDELVVEIRSYADPVLATLAGNDRPALVWNLAVHHADLHEALGRGRPSGADVAARGRGDGAVARRARVGVRRRTRLRAVPDVLLPAIAGADLGLEDRPGPGDPRRAQHLRPPRRRPTDPLT